MSEQGHRRIDRIRDPAFVEDLEALSLEQLRARRDECLAEREYLSFLRRLLQGRAEILRAELERRSGRGGDGSLVERLAEILAGEAQGPARGEAVRVSIPEEEVLHARRRIERLVTDAAISDPSGLDDERLAEVADRLVAEEQEISRVRGEVIAVLDRLQGELKRRYREDPSLALS